MLVRLRIVVCPSMDFQVDSFQTKKISEWLNHAEFIRQTFSGTLNAKIPLVASWLASYT